MKEKVQNFIEQHKLIQSGQPVIVALSGGADSVALLRVLHQLCYPLLALHCNFHLRGEESDRDENFVRQLCESLQIPLHVKHFDTSSYAHHSGQSIEMAARTLRYEWFEQEREKANIKYIAVAHHKNDQAETLLLNLVRGTGLKGLKGMLPCNGKIIRPLLCVERKEILHYLKSICQEFVTDSTNQERDAVRNRIRLDIIPMLKSINPSIINTLSTVCDNIQGALYYYERGISEANISNKVTSEKFPIDHLSTDLHDRTLLHEWLEGKGFTSTQEEEMIQSHKVQTGRMWYSSTHRILRDRANLIIQPNKIQLEEDEQLPVIQQELVNNIDQKTPDVAYVDGDLITEPLRIRYVRKGDTFHPFGMKGKKLVSDFMTNCKLNRFEKEKQLVVTCGEKIVWLVGLRSDNRFRITEKTTNIVKLRIKQ